jgi:hypothetical protein
LPLAAITALHTAGGLAHTHAMPPELPTLAADQFACGIFQKPHAPTPSTPTPTSTYTHMHILTDTHVRGAPQRLHVLFTLASEVLAVAERLEDAGLRARWATWADAVFLQMHMEVDVDAWCARLGAVCGRCWTNTLLHPFPTIGSSTLSIAQRSQRCSARPFSSIRVSLVWGTGYV